MAVQSKVGSRYARAFFDLLDDVEKAKSFVEELDRFNQAMKASSELTLVCQGEVFGASRRREVVEAVVAHLGLSDLAKKVLLVLSEAKRLIYVEEISETLRLLALEKAGIEPIQVQSADELSAEERQATIEKFSKLIGKPVEASFEKVPSLLGGVRVTAAGKTYDGSLATRLAALEEQMLGGY